MWDSSAQNGTPGTDLGRDTSGQNGTPGMDLGWDSPGQNGTLGSELEPAQWLAIEALVAGSTASAAAQAARVGRSTLYRWFAQPHFAAALGQAKREHLAMVHARMRSLASEAVAMLGETIRSEKAALLSRAGLAFQVLKAVGADVPEQFEGGSGAGSAERSARRDRVGGAEAAG